MSSLDKTWFTPALKIKHKEIQKEFYKNGKSDKWKRLKSVFRRAKRKASNTFYSEFVTELKQTKPGQYYKMAKKIGGIEQQNSGDLNIECLEGMEPQHQVKAVAKAFAETSCEYEPVNITHLPSYLPAKPAPQLQVYNVYKKNS